MNKIVVGVDEVGKGSLGGPVVSAAVVLPNSSAEWVEQIRDSKKLSSKKREYLSEYIMAECVYAIREASSKQIDTENILQATLKTMSWAVNSVVQQIGRVDLVLVDGNHEIPGLDYPQEAVKGGDDIYKSIGAASIIAKVYRDNYMKKMDAVYPEYGFCRNSGYGTKEHVEALYLYGPCDIHRRSFRPLKDLI